jgi:hypothetical protein
VACVVHICLVLKAFVKSYGGMVGPITGRCCHTRIVHLVICLEVLLCWVVTPSLLLIIILVQTGSGNDWNKAAEETLKARGPAEEVARLKAIQEQKARATREAKREVSRSLTKFQCFRFY